MKFGYSATSLRTLLPDHWGDTAFGMDDGEILETKNHFAFHSIILGYGSGPIEKLAPNKELALFIKEHCRAAMRTKAISVYAYEAFGDSTGRRHWTNVGSAAYLCLTSAISSIDAISCVLWALIFGQVPTGKYLPDFPTLITEVKSKCPTDPIGKKLIRLSKSKWIRNLREARRKVVHRGEWPVWKDPDGFALSGDRGLFDVHLSAHKKRTPRVRMQKLNLPFYMKGFISGLEKWERSSSTALRRKACFKSFNPKGRVFTFPVIGWGNGISDHFTFGEMSRPDFDTAEEYIAWRNRIWSQPENAIKTFPPGSHAM